MNIFIRLSIIILILLQSIISNGQSYPEVLKHQKSGLDDLLKKPENKNPYPSQKQILDVTKSNGTIDKAGIQLNEHKLPSGWVYEVWNNTTLQYEEQARMDLKYPMPTKMLSYYIAGKDTLTYVEIELLPDFKNSDVLDYILPGDILNAQLIRSYNGKFWGSFKSYKGYEKVKNKWKLVTSQSDKTDVPYGFEYASGYSCKDPRFEFSTSGSKNNDIWTVTQLINIRDLASDNLLQEWKDIYKKDKSGNRVNYDSYQKVNEVYITHFSSSHKYDNQNREIQKIDNNSKVDIIYTHKDEYKGFVARWNGTDWVESLRTLDAKMYTGNDGLIYNEYIQQVFSNNQWINGNQITYGYDQKDSLRVRSEASWDNASQSWKEQFVAKYKLDQNGQTTEFEWYDSYGGGSKTEYSTDPKTGVRYNLVSECSTLDDFLNGIYSPSVIYESHEASPDTLDYYIEKRYQNNKWVQVDSIANVYDKNGDILIMADSNITTKSSSRYRFLYNKTEDAVKPVTLTEISIYPNPAKKLLKISGPDDKYTIHIYTLDGKKMMYQENVSEVDISNLSAGTYLISINLGGKLAVKKMIKI